VAEFQQEEQDRRMLARLDEVRLLQIPTERRHSEWHKVATAYAEAFRKYGIEVRGATPANLSSQLLCGGSCGPPR
jgi:hypothetical protein